MKLIDPSAKTNWKYLAIVVVFALFVSGGIFLLKSMHPVPVAQTPSTLIPSLQPQTFDTSTWQTYRNDEFGFEMKYPRDWNIEENGKKIRIFGEEHTAVEKECKENEQKLFDSGVNFGPTGCRSGVFISVLDKSGIDQQYDVWTSYILPNIDGAFMLNRDYLAPHLAITAPTRFNKSTYVLIEFYLTEVGLSEQNKEFLNQILSTFRFVEKTPTTEEGLDYTRLETCRYGILTQDKYLNEYVVQVGDTLLSIAKKQLESTSRINEIVFLNYKQYPSIYTDYNNIKPGWKFYLPPRFLERTSGSLIGYNGKLTQGTYGPQLLLNARDPSESFRAPFNIWEDTLYFGDFVNAKPKEGDCVAIIVDTLPGSIALAVFPQYEENDSPIGLELDSSTASYEYNYSYEYRSPCDYENLLKLNFSEYTVKKGDSLYDIAKSVRRWRTGC